MRLIKKEEKWETKSVSKANVVPEGLIRVIIATQLK